MTPNLRATLQHLFAALAHSIHASLRTRQMVRDAIARFITLAAMVPA